MFLNEAQTFTSVPFAQFPNGPGSASEDEGVFESARDSTGDGADNRDEELVTTTTTRLLGRIKCADMIDLTVRVRCKHPLVCR